MPLVCAVTSSSLVVSRVCVYVPCVGTSPPPVVSPVCVVTLSPPLSPCVYVPYVVTSPPLVMPPVCVHACACAPHALRSRLNALRLEASPSSCGPWVTVRLMRPLVRTVRRVRPWAHVVCAPPLDANVLALRVTDSPLAVTSTRPHPSVSSPYERLLSPLIARVRLEPRGYALSRLHQL